MASLRLYQCKQALRNVGLTEAGSINHCLRLLSTGDRLRQTDDGWLSRCLSALRTTINWPPENDVQFNALAFDTLATNSNDKTNSTSVLDQLMQDPFLWVQKHRRSVEIRLRRKMGSPTWAPHGAKLLQPKPLVICDSCGNYYEAHTLCVFCYKQVKEETERLHKEIKDQIGDKSYKEEIEIRYKNDERNEVPKKRIIEVNRERPHFFAKNLLSKPNTSKWTETNVNEAEEQPKFKE